jgi:hypothetical protein
MKPSELFQGDCTPVTLIRKQYDYFLNEEIVCGSGESHYRQTFIK